MQFHEHCFGIQTLFGVSRCLSLLFPPSVKKRHDTRHGAELLAAAQWPETITIAEALARQAELPAGALSEQVLQVPAGMHWLNLGPLKM